MFGDDDVGRGGVAQRRAVFADVQQTSGGDAFAVDTDGPGRDEVGESDDAVVVREFALLHEEGDVVVLRRAHDPLQVLEDLDGQYRFEAGEELADVFGRDVVGVLELEQPVVGLGRIVIRESHDRADAEVARLAVQGDLVEAWGVQALTDIGQIEWQGVGGLAGRPSMDVVDGVEHRVGDRLGVIADDTLTVEEPVVVPLVVQVVERAVHEVGGGQVSAVGGAIELGDDELQGGLTSDT